MNEENKKVVLILLVFSTIFFLGILPILLKDFEGTDKHRHFVKTNGCKTEELEAAKWTKEICENYKPLLGVISSPFAFSKETFLVFQFLILGVLTPLLLYLISRNWVSVLLYFCVTSYFFYHIDGIYPQAFVALLALGILATRDWRIQLVLVGLSSFTHGHGLMLTLLFFVATNLYRLSGIGKRFFVSCSGTFGTQKPLVFSQTIFDNIGGRVISLGELVYSFARVIPLPFLVISFREFILKKKIGYLAILFFTVLYGFITSTRIFYVSALVMILGLALFYEKLGGKEKKWFLWIVVLFGLYQLYTYFNLKYCVGLF